MERTRAMIVSCFLEIWNIPPSFGSGCSPSLNRQQGVTGRAEGRGCTLDLAACKMLAQRKAWNYPYLKVSLCHRKKSGVCMYAWERKSFGDITSLKSFLLVTHDDLPSGLVSCILPVKATWALWVGKLSFCYWFCDYFTQLFPRSFISSQLLSPLASISSRLSFGGHHCSPASWEHLLVTS